MRWGRLIWVLLGVSVLAGGLAACGTGWEISPTAPPMTLSAAPSISPASALPLAAALEEPDSLLRYPARRPLVIYFTRPMDPQSAAHPADITPTVKGTWNWNAEATRLTFTPERGFLPGGSYRISLSEALASAGGERLGDSPAWRIQIALPPVVSRVAGLDEQRNPVDLMGSTSRWPSIRVTFNQEMDAARTVASLHVSPTLAFSAAVRGRELWITPTKPLAFQNLYRFSLDGTATNLEGITMTKPYSWIVRTLPFRAAARWPATVAQHDALQIEFNYRVAGESFLKQWAITPPLSGTVTWNEAQTRFTVRPSAPVTPGQLFTVSFRGVLEDLQGVEMARVAPLPVGAPPLVLAVAPDGSGADRSEPVRLTFGRAMDAETVEKAFSILPEVPGVFSWTEQTLSFLPAGCLDADASYTITLAPTARDISGTVWLEAPLTWNFKAGNDADTASFDGPPNVQVMELNGPRIVQAELSDWGESVVPECLALRIYRFDSGQFLAQSAALFPEPPEAADDVAIPGPLRTPLQASDLPLIAEIPITAPVSRGNLTLALPQELSAGFYLLEFSGSGQRDDPLIVVLTDNKVVAKLGGSELVAWVTDSTGEPQADTPVSVYASDGQRVASGRTDARGVFRGDVPFEPAPVLVLAGEGAEITVSGLIEDWKSVRSQTLRGDGPPEPLRETPTRLQQWRIYLYTDRPIYRSGQTVAYKAILRRDRDGRYEPFPEGIPVTVRLWDARNNLVETQVLTPNAFGTVHGAFRLAEGAVLGDYGLEIEAAGERGRESFKVEDYRKPDYQVALIPERGTAVFSEPLTLTVSSNDGFGRPIPGAEVSIEQFIQVDADAWRTMESRWVSRGALIKGKTDAQGYFTWTFPAKMLGEAIGFPGEYREVQGFEVSVDDGSHQPVNDFAAVEVFRAQETLTVDRNVEFPDPGKPFTVAARVWDRSGAPVAGRELSFRVHPVGDIDKTVITGTVTTDSEGRGVFPLTVRDAGHYELRVAGTDRAGNWVIETVDFYISTESVADGELKDRAMRIYADKPQYVPGEIAELRIGSFFSGTALLTLERGRVRRETVITLTAPETVVTVPIEPGDVPNLYAAVSAWQPHRLSIGKLNSYDQSWTDYELYEARLNLPVEGTENLLRVALEPDRPEYAPGDPATFTVRVTDGLSRPVRAEFSLAAVDARIDALSDGSELSIEDAFYGEREDRVETYHSMGSWRKFPSDAGGCGGEPLESNDPRRNFPDTALWMPVLETDAGGIATVTLQLPDNLTRWRLTARAVTADTRVGEGQVEILTRKPLMVQPLLPRTLVAGDTVSWTAWIHNAEAATRAVTLSLDGPAEGAATQTLTLGPGERALATWPVTVGAAAEISAVMRAESAEGGRDAVQVAIPVQPPADPVFGAQVGMSRGGVSLTLDYPGGVLTRSAVQLDLQPSTADSVLEGLEYLVDFPYGCVEQTMSRVLPDAVVGRALDRLEIERPELEAELPRMVGEGVQRLYGYQHSDGGWGWFYDDDSHPYQTAWVVFGLATIADAGYDVDPAAIRRGVDWINAHLETMDPQTRAYALYSLAAAGQPNLTATLALTGELASLDTFGRAGLALALYEAGEENRAEAVVDLLARTAVIEDGRVSWPGGAYDGYRDRQMLASATRGTALALSAFVRIRPGHKLESGIVGGLMSQRRESGWGSTNETAYTVLALTDYLQGVKGPTSPVGFPYSVRLNGTAVTQGFFDPDDRAIRVDLPLELLQPGTNTLQLDHPERSLLYYKLRTGLFVSGTATTAAGPIQVTRRYWDVRAGKPVTQATAGQLVAVQLKLVLPEDGHYLIVEDPVPGGLEPLNERLNTTSRVGLQSTGDGAEEIWFQEEYGYNYKEIREDRVALFITSLKKGTYIYTYLARVMYEGRFCALPTRVWEMYGTALWGRSERTILKVGP